MDEQIVDTNIEPETACNHDASKSMDKEDSPSITQQVSNDLGQHISDQNDTHGSNQLSVVREEIRESIIAIGVITPSIEDRGEEHSSKTKEDSYESEIDCNKLHLNSLRDASDTRAEANTKDITSEDFPSESKVDSYILEAKQGLLDDSGKARERPFQGDDEGTSLKSMSSADSGIDLDEKTRNQIFSSSHSARARRSKKQHTLSRKGSTGSFCSLSSSDSSGMAKNHKYRNNRDASTHISKNSEQKARPSEGKRGAASKAIPSLHCHESTALPSGESDIIKSEEFAVPTSRSGESPREQNIDLEAQMAPEVLSPGAFAVSGMEQVNLASGYDSGFDNETVGHDESSNEPESPTQSVGPTTSETPVQAELYEEHFADAQILEENIYTGSEDGGKQRLTSLQKYSVLATLGVLLGMILVIVLTRKRQHSEKNNKVMPIIEGWNSVGNVLTGPIDQDNAQFGYSIGLSADGKRLAIGLPGLKGGEDSAFTVGGVFIMDLKNDTDWTQVEQIYGDGPDSLAGKSVKISTKGDRVAIGCPGKPGEKSGYVAVYEEGEGPSWVQVGEPIHGEEGFGGSLAFSEDGSIIAIGTIANINDGDVRTVSVYRYVGGSWIPLGAKLDTGASGYFGWSLSISGDGMRLAVATLGIHPFLGQLSIFDFNGDIWEKVGNDIDGESEGHKFGDSVALSSNGKVVAVGASTCSKGELVRVGCVEIFQLDSSEDSWKLMGEPIIGDESFDSFGSTVSLSADGKIVAVGVPDSDAFDSGDGHLQVLKFHDNQWVNVGSRLFAEKATGFGSTLALSPDGMIVAGGAPLSDFDGLKSKVGQVLVFNATDESD